VSVAGLFSPVLASSADTCPLSSNPNAIVALVFLLAAAAVAVLAAYLRYRRRGPAWVKAHVAVRPRHGPGATFRSWPGKGPDRDHAFTVIPAEVGRSTTVQENGS
jgi:hypothetical protein